MDPRGLNREIPKAKKTIEINRHHLKHLRKVLSDFTPYPVSKPSEKIWAPEKECLANTPEATASNQSTDSVSHDPQIPSSVPLLHTYAPISEEEPMIDADVPPFTPHFSNESQPVTVETEEESTCSALLVKIEMLKKIRIAPIKQPGTVLMAPSKDDKDVHDTGGHGIESAKEEGDLLETKLEFKINETANEPWMRLEKVVQLVVAERLTVFEKNLQELYGRMMKIEMAIKEQTQIHKLSRELQMAKEDLVSKNVSMVDATEPTSLSTPATASTPTQGPSDVSNSEKPGGLPAEQSSCQTNSKGKYYIEPEKSDSVDAFTHLKFSRPGNWKSSFAINPPPSLPRLASLLCLNQLPHDALWTPVPGQPVLSICLTNQKAVELTWSMPVEDRAALERVHSYHLFACPVTTSLAPQRLAWKNIGVVRAETLPMTYRLTDIQAGCKFFFAVCAQDIYTRFGPFSRPLYLKWLFGSSLVD
ncbi:activating transcription factor 7-interacting protein 2-like [Alosa sapidissima]|uniref:activating transcription factor 7-interacting protein 2-like n=1 Tax=Alosa sapidissima TaxID=34773 RepID=UPI001C09B7AF|nr:activating transcription factor 7-interacting protein 2-like [Alosa sapidissima]XP_041942548.1 activating transcription factor 7-interacting protein 2-like [Alosa sapidissima]